MKVSRHLIRSSILLLLAISLSNLSVWADPPGREGSKGKSNAADRAKKDRDDKKRAEDGKEAKSADNGIENRLGRIGEIVPREDKERSLPPAIEAMLADDQLKNAPPAWGKWSRIERYRWLKDMEKYREQLHELRKSRKDFSDADLDHSLKSLEALTALGVEPKDATAALNGLIAQGFRGDDLAGAFRGFSAGDAVKSAGDSGGLGDILRGKLEDLLAGKGAVLLDILGDGGVSQPTANPAPAPAPGSGIPGNPAPPAGGAPTISPAKDSTPDRIEKKGKMRNAAN